MQAELPRATPSPERRVPPRTLAVRDKVADTLRGFGALAPPAGHTPWLDGWRGLCIAVVLLGHFTPFIGHLAPLGVEMFFALSGRLMAELLIVRRQPLILFVLRRASRILPLLALYVGVVTVALAAGALMAGNAVNWLSPVATLLFFGNYLSDPAALLEHTWSLGVEEHSYLLLALVAAVSARNARIAGFVAMGLAVSMAIRGALLFYDGVETGPFVFWRSDVRGASVLFSFALCLWLRQFERREPWRIVALVSPLCALGILFCRTPGVPATPLAITVCTLLASVSVNTIQFSALPFRQFLSHRLLTWLGTLSFSLYIWQQPFFLASKGGFPAMLAVPLVFACAIWSYLRIEAPVRRWLNRRWDRLPGALASVPRQRGQE